MLLTSSSPLVLLLGAGTSLTPCGDTHPTPSSLGILPTPLVQEGLSKPYLLPRAGISLFLPWRPPQCGWSIWPGIWGLNAAAGTGQSRISCGSHTAWAANKGPTPHPRLWTSLPGQGGVVGSVCSPSLLLGFTLGEGVSFPNDVSFPPCLVFPSLLQELLQSITRDVGILPLGVGFFQRWGVGRDSSTLGGKPGSQMS